MASRKIPVGYFVRRPLTLWGSKREIGEYIKHEEVASIVRIEALVRAGRLNPVYEEGEQLIERHRTNSRAIDKQDVVEEFQPKTKKKVEK